MSKTYTPCTLGLIALIATTVLSQLPQSAASVGVTKKTSQEKANMDLGNFSVSLAVDDIKKSKTFYEKLDFKQVGGKLEQNWVVMQNGTTKIGLFQGLFEEDILTFNPGWDSNGKPIKEFQDVRDIQATLKKKGINPIQAADESTTGPASFVIADPDGNMILIDQHVPKPQAK